MDKKILLRNLTPNKDHMRISLQISGQLVFLSILFFSVPKAFKALMRR